MIADQIQNFLISEEDLLREKASKRLTQKERNDHTTSSEICLDGLPVEKKIRPLGFHVDLFLERIVKEDKHSPHLMVSITFNRITAAG